MMKSHPTEAEFDELKRKRDDAIIEAVKAARKKFWPDVPEEEPINFHSSEYKATCYCNCPSGPCQHEFSGWREFEDGHGGEQFCQRCGMGSMQHSLKLDF